MSVEYLVSLTINADSNMDRQIAVMNRSLRGLQTQTSQSAQVMNTALGGALAASVGQLTSATVGYLKGSVGEFMAFEHHLTVAAAKFGGIEKGDVVYQQLKKTIQDVGASSEFSTSAASDAMENLATSGFSAEQSIAMLPKLVNIATASNISLAEAADIAGKSLGTFGMMDTDPTKLAKNVDVLTDSLVKTANMGMLDMPTLFETIKNGAGAFTSMGQGVNDFNALAVAMSKFGKVGPDAGTALKIVALQLSTLPKPAKEAMASLGVNSFDATGNMRPIIDILDDIQKKTVNMKDSQKQSIFKDIFGSEAIAAIAPLMTSGMQSVRDYQKTLAESAGTASQVAEKNRQSFQNQNELFKSALSGVSNAIWDKLQQPMTAAMSVGSQFFSNITLAINDPKAGIEALSSQFAILNTQITSLGLNAIAGLKAQVSSMMIEINTSFSQMPIWGGFLASLAAGVIAMTLAYQGYTVAVTIAKNVQMIYNATMLAFNGIIALNPIYWLIGGIVAAVAGVVYAYKHFEGFRDLLNSLWEKAAGFGQAIGSVFGMKFDDKKLSSSTFDVGKSNIKSSQPIIASSLQQMQNPITPMLSSVSASQVSPSIINTTANGNASQPVVNVNSNYDEMIKRQDKLIDLQQQQMRQQSKSTSVNENNHGGHQS